MPYVIIENFSGGLDLRRLPAVSTPGSLLELVNAHITRGGEIEKRKAFDSYGSIPSGTIGLASDGEEMWVFGAGLPPPTLPPKVNYQRLLHPDAFHELVEIHSWTLYAGKLYVAAEFDNGDIVHFYDGEPVENWFDGKARGGFRVTASSEEVGRKSNFAVEFGKDNQNLQVTVFMNNPEDPDEPIDLTNGAVTILDTDSSSDYATKIRDAINANSGDTGVEVMGPGPSTGTGWLLFFRTVEATVNLDGRSVWFRVVDPDAFNIDPVADTDSFSCTGATHCTNVYTLLPNVTGGTPPYTYSWEILDAGGASATLSSQTDAEPELRVSGATAEEDCNVYDVLIRLIVTDDSSPALEEQKDFFVRSAHCSFSLS